MRKKPSFYELEDSMIIPDSAQSKLINTSIEDVITETIFKIDASQQILNPQLSAQEILNIKTAELKHQSINSATIADFQFQLTPLNTDSRRRQEAALELSYIYIALAQKCLGEESFIQAWHAVAQSEYYLGMLHELHARHTAGPIEADTSRAEERARDGGNIKHENHKRLKELALNTLNDINIKTSSSSTKDAAKAISIKLHNTLHDEKLLQGKKSSEIIDFFEKMIDTDEEVGKAFWDRKALP